MPKPPSRTLAKLALGSFLFRQQVVPDKRRKALERDFTKEVDSAKRDSDPSSLE